MINLDCKVDVTLQGGYTHSLIFVLKGEKFLFSHNSKTGQTDIWNLEVGGLPKFSKKWSAGWTNIDFYEYKGEVYFFHQKGAEGTARICKLDYNSIMNGTEMGPKVYENKWSTGWTTTKFFVHNDVVYFLHYKAEDGLTRLNACTKGGDVGTKIYEKNWSKGYTNFAMTTNGGNFFILYQKEDEGTCVINNIDLAKLETAARAGLLTPNLGTESYREKWTTGWSNIEFFTLNNEVYMFHNKADEGTARITKLNPNGTLEKKYYDKNWSAGWSSIDIFYKDGKPMLMHQKKSTGQTKICELKF
ncbi:MAG: hypothetical protein CVU05_03110 [Bacteroidetes bacterium HGW-Bacteroidetes-21]|nr:MAG: hypothetical protein CVU05_03110 [Bacteroidetes bacterium HGW-Bacteroidetes-21]